MNNFLECHDVSMNTNDVPLLNKVDFSLVKGELHVLLGENGSGKSTLANVLCGAYPNHVIEGTILLDGKPLYLKSPKDALLSGITTLHQDPFIYDELSVADNLFLNSPIIRPYFRTLKHHKKVAITKKLFQNLGISISPDAKGWSLNLAMRRMIEIIRLGFSTPSVLILDEPLSGLDEQFNTHFYKLITRFKRQGVSILYITHNLEEILPFTDRISVLRDGALVDTITKTQLASKNIDQMIWGEFLSNRYPKIHLSIGKEVLCLENVSCNDVLKNISLSLHKGEILGVTGLVGSGKTLLAKAISGIVPCTGKIYIDRLETKIQSPKQAISLGLAYITDARIESGLFMDQSSLDNAFSLGEYTSRHFLRRTKFERQQFVKYCKLINLPIDEKKIPENLSGGEQQKLMLMRWLMSYAKIFILDEPTQNIDIASKIDIYNVINDLVVKGCSVLMLSSNLEELTGVCDRILVIRGGCITGEISRDEINGFANIHELM